MIMRHGRLVASGWWAPYTPDRVHLLYSLSKSFTSTAAGFAVAEGLLDLDATVLSYFPEFDADITDPRSRAMLVRHVAAMASGHLAETVDKAFGLDPAEPVRGFLLTPPERDPGTVFADNQPCTYSLAAIIQRVTGQSLTEYLRPRLFEPLGIGEAVWQQNPPGRDIGFSGLHSTTDAIARLGQLYLQGGKWDGEQLLPAEWVAEATRSHVSNSEGTPESAHSDWQQGYGFQFWRGRHGYRGDGAYGQFCVVLPEQDAVVAMTAATDQMQAVLDAMWTHLLPAFGPAPLTGRDEEDEALRLRLSRLELPPAPGKPAPLTGADAWADAEFTPAGGTCADQPTLTGVTVTTGADGWTLTLAEDESRLALRIDGAGWALDVGPNAPVPTATSGGWTDENTLSVDIAFLETPHRLAVTCALPDRTFTARWGTTPLQDGPLRSHRAPRP
jgi:CubicO group peptidase (beta-lactamase class C family)